MGVSLLYCAFCFRQIISNSKKERVLTLHVLMSLKYQSLAIVGHPGERRSGIEAITFVSIVHQPQTNLFKQPSLLIMMVESVEHFVSGA